jgi:hypothetical protein
MFLEKWGIAYDPSVPLTFEIKTKIDKCLAEARKPQKPVSLEKLTSNLKKHSDEFFAKASDEDLKGIDAGKKADLANILNDLVKKLS